MSNERKGSMTCQRCGETWNHTRHPTPETFITQLTRFGRKHRDCPPPPSRKKVKA